MTEAFPPVTAIAQFFDDIRLEMTGKMILIGQYNGELLLPPGAAPFDRLSILITAKWPRSYTPSSLTVRIVIPGQVPIEPSGLEIPSHQPLEGEPSPFAGMMMQAIIQCRFPPVRTGDQIEIWLKVDGHEIPTGRLRVVAAEAIPQVQVGPMIIPTAA